MNNKIINPLTGKYVNIDSNEGREIINYYTNTGIDFLIGGEPDVLPDEPPASSPPSDSSKEDTQNQSRNRLMSTLKVLTNKAKRIGAKKCVAMKGATDAKLTPIKQSAKSVAQLYKAILQPIKHTAIPQIVRIAYHLLGKNKQAKTMLINERGKQKLCEAVRAQYNNLNTAIIREIEEELDGVLKKEAKKKKLEQQNHEDHEDEEHEELEGGGKMDYKNDENFIELSDKLGKVTSMLVNSYNSEGYTPELRNNLNELMYNTLENMAIMHVVFEIHEQVGGVNLNPFKKKQESIMGSIANRINRETKSSMDLYKAGRGVFGSIRDIGQQVSKDSGLNDLMKKMPGIDANALAKSFDANALAKSFNQSLNPADASEGLKSVMNKLNFEVPNISSTEEGFIVGMLLPLYAAGLKLPWQMQEMAIRQFDQKLQLLNNCDRGINRICQLINQLIDNYGCEKICKEIARIINEKLVKADDINASKLTEYDDDLMKMAKKGRVLAGVGKKMASEALTTALDKASEKVGNKLGIPNLSKIIPNEKVLKILRIRYLEGNTITEVITKLQPYYEEQDDLKDELRKKKLKKQPNKQTEKKIIELEQKIKDNEREIDNKINKIKDFFIKLPPNAESEGSEIKSILHYYQIEKQKLEEATKKNLDSLAKDTKTLAGRLIIEYRSAKLNKEKQFKELKSIWNNRETSEASVTIEKLKTSLKNMMDIKAGLKNILNLILIPARSIIGDNLINYVAEPITKFIDSSDKKIEELGKKIDNYVNLDTLKDFIIQNDQDGELLDKFLPRLAEIKIIPGKEHELISLREQINSYLNDRKKKYSNAQLDKPSTVIAAQPPLPPLSPAHTSHTAASAANKAEMAADIAARYPFSPMPVAQMGQMPMTPIDPKQMNMMTQQMFMMMMMNYMQNMFNTNKPKKKRFNLF